MIHHQMTLLKIHLRTIIFYYLKALLGGCGGRQHTPGMNRNVLQGHFLKGNRMSFSPGGDMRGTHSLERGGQAGGSVPPQRTLSKSTALLADPHPARAWGSPPPTPPQTPTWTGFLLSKRSGSGLNNTMCFQLKCLLVRPEPRRVPETEGVFYSPQRKYSFTNICFPGLRAGLPSSCRAVPRGADFG